MAKRQVRDSAYYLSRLEKERPTVFADYQAGKHPSVAEACRVAGLKKPRTNIQVLKNGWDKASTVERHEFARWLGLHAAPFFLAPAPVTPPTAIRVIATDRRLEPWVIDRIKVIKAARGLRSNNEVAYELGLSRLNSSIGNAIKCHHRLTETTLMKLEQ
jgi:hypothetical protein